MSNDAQKPDASSEIIAYVVGDASGWTLRPADAKRNWMDRTSEQFAYRCLPLVMANQAGWIIECPTSFTAIWNDASSETRDALEVIFDDPENPICASISSHFGHGVLTFGLPFLFRTTRGLGLLARGAPNFPKFNCHALEGLIETDWNPATFTMNWKIIQPCVPVRFEKGEPICYLQPFEVHKIESLSARIANIDSAPEEKEAYERWRKGRDQFMKTRLISPGWQKDYFHGRHDWTSIDEHKTKINVPPFKKEA